MLAWLLEATVIIDIAEAGDTVAFERWQSLIGGLDLGIIGIAVGIAAIAINETGPTGRTTPAWAAWVAVLAGIVGVISWLVAIGLGIEAAGLGWLVATIVMVLWALWFGIALVRSVDGSRTDPIEQELYEKEVP